MFAISKIFSCEPKFASDCVKRMVYKKYKQRICKQNKFENMRYDRENTID